MYTPSKDQQQSSTSNPNTTEQSQTQPTSAPRTPLPTSASSSEQTPKDLASLYKDMKSIKGLAPFPPPKDKPVQKTQGEDRAALDRVWEEAGLLSKGGDDDKEM